MRATTLKAGGIDISNNIVIYDADKVKQLDDFCVQNCLIPIGKIFSDLRKPAYLSRCCDFFNLTATKYPVKEYQFIHNGEVYFHIIELYLEDNLFDILNGTLII